ncbi:hypothetical protein D3C72_2051240 [compost metagenome]
MSLPPMLRLWQELQEMKPDLDKRGSKNSCLPSSTLATSVIFAGCTGRIGSLVGAAAQAWPPRINPNINVNGLYMVRSPTGLSF